MFDAIIAASVLSLGVGLWFGGWVGATSARREQQCADERDLTAVADATDVLR